MVTAYVHKSTTIPIGLNIYYSDEVLIEINEREEARLYMDDVLDRLEGSFGHLRAALKRERNSTIVPANLTPEILVEILSYGGIQMTLLGIRICHRWRLAAFNCPRLWSRIDVTSKKYLSNLLTVQLERSGSYPLDVTFNPLDTPRIVSDPSLQMELTSLMVRSSSVSNLLTGALPPKWAEPLPLLESLHLIVSRSTQMEESLKASKLRHVSIDCVLNDMPLSPSIVRNLQTLHLRLSRDPAIKILEIVLASQSLQELFLDTYQNAQQASVEQVDSMIEKARFTPLQLVSLKSVSPAFMACFLRPEITSSSTSLRVAPRPPTYLTRQAPATAAWINTSRHWALYEHDEGMTYIDLETPPSSYHKILYHMATFINFSMVTSLYWKGANLQDTTFQLFPSMRFLAFEYYPAIVGEPRQSLKDIIGGCLVSSCPHLEYLGISIRRHKSTSLLIQRDNSELELPAFLETWMDTYGNSFSKVEIYDEYRPLRWENETLLDAFKALAGSVEFKECCVLDELQPPRFRETRRFVFEKDDENSVSFRRFRRGVW